MCVIIHRPAGIEIPFDKLKIACQKNNDGFGVAVFDRGKLDILRVWNPKGNDPAALAKILEEAKDNELFVHLRLRSVGNKNADNVHPFPFYKEGDVQYALMHNGTMNEYNRGKGQTDSEVFAHEIVKPLLQNWKGDEPLNDAAFEGLLSKISGVGGFNKIVVMNSLGHSIILNKSAGAEILPGVWASNSHSFESYSYHGGTGSTVPFRNTTTIGGKGTGPAASSTSQAAYTKAERKEPEEKSSLKEVPASEVKAKPRELFIEKAGLTSLEDAAITFSESDIKELVENYPDDAVNLILDLLDELYFLTQEEEEEAAEVATGKAA